MYSLSTSELLKHKEARENSPLGVGDGQNVLLRATRRELRWVVLLAFGDGVRESARGVPVSIQDVHNGVSSFLATETCPDNLVKFKT